VRNVARLFRAVEDSYVLQGWRKREHVYVRPFTPKWPPFVSASRALLPSGDSGRNGRRFRVGPFIRRAPTVLPRMIILPTFSMKKCTKKKKKQPHTHAHQHETCFATQNRHASGTLSSPPNLFG
jgi:hypothetical protein